MKPLFTLFLLASSFAWGIDPETIRASIFKVSSKLPGLSQELRGSGILFTKDSKFYVLTSDHVVGHSNEMMITHSAVNSLTGQNLNLIFKGAEWGLGLALLEVYKPAATLKAPRYEDLLAPSNVKSGETAAFFGYPFESNDLTEETEAKVVEMAVSLPYYVMAPQLIEFDALIGEFGMSGGGAFSADGNFMGILAYQKILNGTGDNRVYALPQKIVTDWMGKYFQEAANYKPVFSEPWWGQTKPDQVILTNNGYFLAFKVQKGEVRNLAGRMEALLFFKDIPTVGYDDTRGILKVLREYLDKEVMGPVEFSLIDRNLDVPALIVINYPALAITSLNRKGISLLACRGETHEKRYERFKPKVDQLAKAIEAIKPAMPGDVAKASEELMKRLNAMPPKPTDPGNGGAVEFFSSLWIGNTILSIEQIQKLAGSEKLKESLDQLVESLNVLEIKGN